MGIKKNWRELILIVLGILVIITPFVAVDTILGWVEVVLGIAVIIVGGWPLIFKEKMEKLG